MFTPTVTQTTPAPTAHPMDPNAGTGKMTLAAWEDAQNRDELREQDELFLSVNAYS